MRIAQINNNYTQVFKGEAANPKEQNKSTLEAVVCNNKAKEKRVGPLTSAILGIWALGFGLQNAHDIYERYNEYDLPQDYFDTYESGRRLKINEFEFKTSPEDYVNKTTFAIKRDYNDIVLVDVANLNLKSGDDFIRVRKGNRDKGVIFVSNQKNDELKPLREKIVDKNAMFAAVLSWLGINFLTSAIGTARMKNNVIQTAKINFDDEIYCETKFEEKSLYEDKMLSKLDISNIAGNPKLKISYNANENELKIVDKSKLLLKGYIRDNGYDKQIIVEEGKHFALPAVIDIFNNSSDKNLNSRMLVALACELEQFISKIKQ